MKKPFLFALMVIATISLNSCSKDNSGEPWTDDSPIIQFKDPLFLEALIDSDEEFDKNDDGQISEEEAVQVTYLFIINSGIRNLDEIYYFTALSGLYCAENQLTSLDVSKNTALTFLGCSSNQLTALDVS